MTEEKKENQCPTPGCKDKMEAAIDHQCELLNLMRDEVARHSLVIFGDVKLGHRGIIDIQSDQADDIRKIKTYALVMLLTILANSAQSGFIEWVVRRLCP